MSDAMTSAPTSAMPHVPSSPDLAGAPFPSVEEILPHRGTMLLIDAVLVCDEDTLTARAHVEGDAWYADAEGAMPTWIGIELMAQAIAAHVGLLAMRAGKPMRPGVLLGSSRYEAHVPAFARNAPLTINVKALLRSEEGHGAYECVIQYDGAVGAEAVIKVFQPRDFQSFIEEGFRS
jgi:predicted hotdog family 3-hydroxylacyl-ACP dehydratase